MSLILREYPSRTAFIVVSTMFRVSILGWHGSYRSRRKNELVWLISIVQSGATTRIVKTSRTRNIASYLTVRQSIWRLTDKPLAPTVSFLRCSVEHFFVRPDPLVL